MTDQEPGPDQAGESQTAKPQPRMIKTKDREYALGTREDTYRTAVQTNSGVNVLDAARGRIRWLWDEFDGNVTVSTSGGKDSAVVLELAAEVARERGQVLRAAFLDQEAEWQATRDYLRELKDTREDVNLEWYQIPFRLFNATAYGDEWADIWPDEEPPGGYMREKEPDSIKENIFGTDRFGDVLRRMNMLHGGVTLTGMRIEESPARRLGSTAYATYKWATWGSNRTKLSREEKALGNLKPAYMMNPIYDWSVRDVWKYLDDTGAPYNRLYDEMFRYGVPTRDMRVSSLVHAVSLPTLNLVQELEPETWVNLVRRYPGINSYGHVGTAIEEEYTRKLPPMFQTWEEYLAHLLHTLIDEEHRGEFLKMRASARAVLPWLDPDEIDRQMIRQVFRNNYHHTSAFNTWVTAQRSKRTAKARQDSIKRGAAGHGK